MQDEEKQKLVLNDSNKAYVILQTETNPSVELQERYQTFFSKEIRNRTDKTLSKTSYSSLFEAQGIKYDQKTSYQCNITISLIKQSINSEVTTFQVRWGRFSINMIVLNIIGSSQIHKKQYISGSYGCIYKSQLLGRQFVIKCLQFKRQQNVSIAIYMAIKEYFLLRIASALKVGPAIHKWLGFDILLYQNCIQFAIQFCDQLEKVTEHIKREITQNLYLMHKFGLIHFDIKPDNLMFSPTYERVVFIDFGLSELVHIQVGQKMLVSFRGTLSLCSTDMIVAFATSERCMIDSYYNDVCCLEGTFLQFKKDDEWNLSSDSDQEIIHDYLKKIDKDNISVLLAYYLKYLLFEGKFAELTYIFALQQTFINNHHIEDVLQFLYELNPSIAIIDFYDKHIKSYKKDGMNYRMLFQIYRNRFTQLSGMSPNQEKRSIFREYYRKMMNLVQIQDYAMFSFQKIESLLSCNQNSNLTFQLIAKLYLKCISFTNNLFQVNMEQRKRITELLINKSFIWEDESKERERLMQQEDYQQIKEVIICIFDRLMIRFLKLNKQVNRQDKNFLFQLIENMFVINLNSSQEIVSRIQSLYKSTFMNNSDKSQLVLKIYHNNQWLSYRFKDSKQKINEKKQKIMSWYEKKMNEQSQDPDFEYKWIALLLLRSIRQQTFVSLSPDEKILHKLLPKSLRHQLDLELCSKWLSQSNVEDLQARINNIYQLIPNQQKQKSHFFLLNLSDIFMFKIADHYKFIQIYGLIARNINSQQIMSSFLLHFTLQIHQTKDFNKILYIFNDLLYEQNIQMLVRHYAFYRASFMHLLQFNTYSSPQTKFTQKVLLKYSQLVQLIDFKAIIKKRCGSESKQHSCLKITLIDQLMSIKSIYIMITYGSFNQYSFDDLGILFRVGCQTRCLACRFMLINYCYLQKQNQSLFLMTNPKQVSHYQKMFVQNYHIMKALYQQYVNIIDAPLLQSFKKFNYYYLCLFCLRSASYEEQHHGIKQLYYYTKLHDINEIYFHRSINSSNMIVPTLKVLKRHESLEQMSIFLTSLSSIITKHSTLIYYELLMNSIQQFFTQNHSLLDINSLLNYIYQKPSLSDSPNVINIFNICYYIILIYYLIDDHQKTKAKRKIALIIEKHTKKVRQQMNTRYWHFMLKQHQSKMTLESRKWSWLQKKMVKTITQAESTPFHMKSNRKKDKQQSHPLSKIKKKALLLGGPYDIKLPNMNKLSIKANMLMSKT